MSAAPAQDMKVTVLYSEIGEPSVHKAGCAHLKRRRAKQSGQETFTAPDVETVIERIYEDHITSGEATLAECMGGADFAPCTRALPYRQQPAVEEPAVEGSGEETVVHLSARVARFMIGEVGDERLARELSEPDLVRCGRGFTAYVTTTYDRAQLLLTRLKGLLEALESGERPKGAKGGMNFQPEAVAKGVEHITADLAR